MNQASSVFQLKISDKKTSQPTINAINDKLSITVVRFIITLIKLPFFVYLNRVKKSIQRTSVTEIL